MNTYDFLLSIAKAHTSIIGGGKTDEIRFDLPGKSIWSSRLPIVVDGTIVTPQITTNDGSIYQLNGLISFDGNPYAEIERLYAQYKRSVPNRHECLNRGYFKALSSDALTMAELIENQPRVEARYALEGFIVLASAAGLIPWTNPRYFFWQSTTDPDCIIYRDWIMKEELA